MTRRARRTGSLFWGCSRYPTCRFTTSHEPIGALHDADDGPVGRNGEAGAVPRLRSRRSTSPASTIRSGSASPGGEPNPAALATTRVEPAAPRRPRRGRRWRRSAAPAEDGRLRARAARAAPDDRRARGRSGAGGAAAAERFLQALEARGSSPNTIRSYRTGLDAYLGWIEAGGHDWRAPSRAALRAYLARLAEGHGRRTVAQRLAALRSFYRFTTRQGLTAGNPLAALATPRQPRRLPEVLTVAETERLIEAAAEAGRIGESGSGAGGAGRRRASGAARRRWRLRDVAIVETAYAAGLRISELASLTIGAVDLKRGEVRVIGQGPQGAGIAAGPAGARGAGAVPGCRPTGPGRAGAGAAAQAAARALRDGAARRVALDDAERGVLFLNHLGSAPRSQGHALPAGAAAGAQRGCRRASRRIRCATASPRTCSTAEPTCASSRSCSATRAWPRRRSTPTFRRPGCGPRTLLPTPARRCRRGRRDRLGPLRLRPIQVGRPSAGARVGDRTASRQSTRAVADGDRRSSRVRGAAAYNRADGLDQPSGEEVSRWLNRSTMEQLGGGWRRRPDARVRRGSWRPTPSAWDAFVARSNPGSYLQTSAWAEVKAPNGWTPLRFMGSSIGRSEATAGGRPSGLSRSDPVRSAAADDDEPEDVGEESAFGVQLLVRKPRLFPWAFAYAPRGPVFERWNPATLEAFTVALRHAIATGPAASRTSGSSRRSS